MTKATYAFRTRDAVNAAPPTGTVRSFGEDESIFTVLDIGD